MADQSPEQEPLAAEVELYGAVATMAAKVLDAFTFPAETIIELHEKDSDTFLRTGDEQGTEVKLSVEPTVIEISIKTDTYKPRLPGSKPESATSDQYLFRVDTTTLSRLLNPDARVEGYHKPTLSFRHSELREDGYSTEASIRCGGLEGTTVRRTTPLKPFDPTELGNTAPPQPTLKVLDDVMRDHGLPIPDTTKIDQPTEEDVASFVDLLAALDNNFHEVLPAGEYNNGGKTVTVS